MGWTDQKRDGNLLSFENVSKFVEYFDELLQNSVFFCTDFSDNATRTDRFLFRTH
jgi:hypothetical protein